MLRALIICFGLVTTAPALAQVRDQTLADIRQDLTVLYVEIQRLKRELSTTGTPGVALGGTTALERIDAIESELQRVTAKTEQLENRVNQVVTDGTNRIGDLEFRLVELEGGDVSKLGDTTTLGGDTGQPAPAISAPAIEPQGGAQLAVGEQTDFEKAKNAYDAGAYDAAVNHFQTFTETYIGGPLTAEAHFWRGKSLTALGNASGAARAYLEAFSGDPDGVMAPDALLELGISLDVLGQSEEACTMLSEVSSRFPGSAASSEAQSARADMGCV